MRATVDIGGTFTDAVVYDEATGELWFGKTLTTPNDLARGFQTGLNSALQRADVPLGELKAVIHGSTVVINSIIERKGATTALLTTRGFRDVYEMGRVSRPDSFNLRFKKHRPLVPRQLIFEVPERMLADGSVRESLDESAVNSIVQTLLEEDVESVAIVFLHSYLNPSHEARVKEIVKHNAPRLYVSASHDLSREYREYERTSTTAANAYVGPTVSNYLADLELQLKGEGYEGSLMIMQSNGGLSDLETARRQPIQMIESGPAGGVVGTIALCEVLGIKSAIAFDMGGTTAKTSVIQRGELGYVSDYYVGGYNEGLVLRIPVLDIVEIGTGGGSIAWLDDVGGLHVGPLSAGAEPGPACYGRGGTEPTVTDANVVLGRISPDGFLGGEMTLDADAARHAIADRLAGALGVDVERAASGTVEVAVVAMSNAVRRVTLERGLHPRDFTLFAYGGAGPLHASAVAKELSIGRVIIPVAPGHFSALGMLSADMRHDFVETQFRRLREFGPEDIEEAFSRLEESALVELPHLKRDSVDFERSADMRYVGQEHSVTIRVPSHIEAEDSISGIKAAFDEAHNRRYSHSSPGEDAEIVSLRLSVVGRLSKPTFHKQALTSVTPRETAIKGQRAVTFSQGRTAVSQVFDRSQLLPGNTIAGPAVIEDVASVILVDPGDLADVNEYGHLVITINS